MHVCVIFDKYKCKYVCIAIYPLGIILIENDAYISDVVISHAVMTYELPQFLSFNTYSYNMYNLWRDVAIIYDDMTRDGIRECRLSIASAFDSSYYTVDSLIYFIFIHIHGCVVYSYSTSCVRVRQKSH